MSIPFAHEFGELADGGFARSAARPGVQTDLMEGVGRESSAEELDGAAGGRLEAGWMLRRLGWILPRRCPISPGAFRR